MMRAVKILFTMAGLALSPTQDAAASSRSTEIVVIITPLTGEAQVRKYGFSDSSFDYIPSRLRPEDKTFCYIGSAGGVCKKIHEYAAQMNRRHSSGTHDRIGIHSCAITAREGGEDVVTAAYELADDYGSHIEVSRTIKACEPEQIP